MRAINPATEDVLAEVPEHPPERVGQLLDVAASAWREWRATSFAHRAQRMHAVAANLRQKSGELSALMTREMGKPIAQAESEIEKCAACCDHFAEHAAAYLATREIPTEARRSFVRYDPLGGVLAIMPWNFPFWQVFRFAAPTLMAGNVGLLKHAPNVPGCAIAIEQLFSESGFPAGVFTTLLIDTPLVQRVIEHPLVAAVTLTGSSRAGSAVASQAARALKKSVLELGGSDPFIVLPGADIERVARAAASARCVNSGQSCIAAKRFIVVGESEAFAHQLAAVMSRMRVGDPMDRGTEIGPLARLDLLETLDDQVRRSISAGARLLTGGKRIDRRGCFYPPTVLDCVKPGMAAFDEETFGPVAAVIQARDVDEAIELANCSAYGLGASLWTEDLALAEQLAPRLEAGCVFINQPVKSDPRLPFGGIKQSGFGRELAAEGIREFVNVKTVWISDVSRKRDDGAE